MKIKTQINQSAIVEKIKLRTDQLDKNFEKGVQLALTQILLDTQKGLDASGSPTQPYSALHAKARAKKGLPLKPVDHFFTGKMLGSLATRVLEKSKSALRVVIFPSATERHKVRSTDSIRNWFAFSEKAIEKIRKQLK